MRARLFSTEHALQGMYGNARTTMLKARLLKNRLPSVTDGSAENLFYVTGPQDGASMRRPS